MIKNLDRWLSISALAICIVVLIFITIQTIHNQREAGYVARVLEENRERNGYTQNAIEVYRVYIEGLRQSLLVRGIDVPPLPVIKPFKESSGNDKQ